MELLRGGYYKTIIVMSFRVSLSMAVLQIPLGLKNNYNINQLVRDNVVLPCRIGPQDRGGTSRSRNTRVK